MRSRVMLALTTFALLAIGAPTEAQEEWRDFRVCVIKDGKLGNVAARYNQSTGDTIALGQRFSQAYPTTTPPYAARAVWYINNKPIGVGGKRYVKFGLPRILGTTEVVPAGEWGGVPVFKEAGSSQRDILYIPIRPGCEFQPYQVDEGKVPDEPSSAAGNGSSWSGLSDDVKVRWGVQTYERGGFRVGTAPQSAVSLDEIWFGPNITTVLLRFRSGASPYTGTLHPADGEYGLRLRDTAGNTYELMAQSGWFGDEEGYYGTDTLPANTERYVILLFKGVPPQFRDHIDIVEGACTNGCWHFLDIDLDERQGPR